MKKPRKQIQITSLIAIAILAITLAAYGIVSSQPANGKYDTNRNGFIEIENLEQLDAIRHDLDHDGLPDPDGDGEPNQSRTQSYNTAFPTTGTEIVCQDNCRGYELTRSLDFNNPVSYASGRLNTQWTSGQGWTPIGSRTHGFKNNAYKGTFNGNGNTISNLFINSTKPDHEPDGLFGYVEGDIFNIGILNANVTAPIFVGALAGEVKGIIDNCYSTGKVQGISVIGGLVGISDGQIGSSHSTANVYGVSAVGGLVGESRGLITRSYATGNIELPKETRDELRSSANTGGLAGEAQVIRDSYATGNVSSRNTAGGLAGSAFEVHGSYATGNVTGYLKAGGLAGGVLKVYSSYAKGTVTLKDSEYPYVRSAGGLTGIANMIVASYSIGEVAGPTGEYTYLGGLVGSRRNEDDGLEVIDSYWDTQKSKVSFSAGGKGKTTTQLQSPTGYTGAFTNWEHRWDFGDNKQYPALVVDLNGDGEPTWQEFGTQRGATPSLATPSPSTPTLSTARPTPTTEGREFTQVTYGKDHVCVLQHNGRATCYGDNSKGQATPPSNVRFSSLGSGDQYTCGIRTSDKALMCWGSIAGTFHPE